MTRLSWGTPGTRIFETGADRGVFYPSVGPGIPWNGLVSVTEEISGAEASVRYVDGIPVRTPKTKESFAAVLQALHCPREFEEYDGTTGSRGQQRRNPFSLSYRTLVGNDVMGKDYAYKIHFLYNVMAQPTSVDSKSINSGGPDTTPFSWSLSTTPVQIPGAKPAAHLIIDTRFAYPEAVARIEDFIYGSDTDQAGMPTPQQLYDLVEEFSILMIVDHGDGNWSAIGPDEIISMIDPDTFEIDWPSAVYLDEDTYRISSL